MRPEPRRTPRAALPAPGLLAVALVVTLVVGGCATGASSVGGSDAPEPAPVTALDTPAALVQPDPDPWWWLDTAPSPDAAVIVTGVRTETRDGADRIVLDLDGDGEPGWGVDVVESAADDATGEPVEVAGDQIVRLRLAGIAAPDAAGHAGVEPQVIDVGGHGLTRVAVRPWDDSTLTVFLGVTGPAARHDDPRLAVSVDRYPLRLTVDVPHS